MKTKELNEKAFAYIINAIDSEGYEVKTTTDTEKLQFLADTFKKEYVNEYNLRQYGNYTNVFANWLMGLPSAIAIDFEYYRIIEIAKEWGSIPQNATGRQEDKVCENWFNLLANKAFRLMKKHKVLPH